MKQIEKLKLILIVLVIILLSIISFGGIYIQNKNRFDNIMPEYLLGRDLKGYRKVELKVSDATEITAYDEEGNEQQTPVNSEELLTKENYKAVKKVVENRLKTMNVTDYVIKLNEEDGSIVLEIVENSDTDRVVGQLYSQGKFEIVDNDTKEVLMTNDDIKTVKSGYGTTSSGVTAVFLNIEFNKEGKEKFRNITNTYIETTVIVENTEETESEEEVEEKKETITKEISLMLDGEKILTTHFDQEVSNGILQLSLGMSTSKTVEELQEYLTEANSMSALLSSGRMPIIYEVEQNKFIYSDITTNEIQILISILVVLTVIGIVYLISRYKVKGILGAILLIGYIAILLICIRVFNVELTLGGIATIALNIILNIIVLNSILNKKQVLDVVKQYALICVPVLIIAIVFTFTNIAIGPVLFWGIIISLLYHLSFSNMLLK